MQHTITIRPAVDERPGWTEVNLAMDGNDAASRCGILALQMRIGVAVVRMDGIGGVGTEEAFRNRGLARHVLDAAVAHMTAGDGAVAMLYGIPDFYHKFGYTTAGPDYGVELPLPKERPTIHAGWSVRAFASDDFAAVRKLYDEGIAAGCGAAVRDPDAYPWTRLRALPAAERIDECRVVVDPDGTIRGYVWQASGCGFMPYYAKPSPEKFLLAEAFATDPVAADVLLNACIDWGFDEAARRGTPVEQIVLYVPPSSVISNAAMLHNATIRQSYSATGGAMVRVLDVERLLRSLLPELRVRLAAARSDWTGTLHISTDIGSASLAIVGEAIDLVGAYDIPADAFVLRLPQTALGRLALGTLPPRDVLTRLQIPVDANWSLIETLFPQLDPHLYLADRY